MKMKNITTITMMMKMITMMMTTMTTEEYSSNDDHEDDNDDDARMPRDLVTDPGERRDWLEKCRVNKLKVVIMIMILYGQLSMQDDYDQI